MRLGCHRSVTKSGINPQQMNGCDKVVTLVRDYVEIMALIAVMAAIGSSLLLYPHGIVTA